MGGWAGSSPRLKSMFPSSEAAEESEERSPLPLEEAVKVLEEEESSASDEEVAALAGEL